MRSAFAGMMVAGAKADAIPSGWATPLVLLRAGELDPAVYNDG